MQVDYEHIDLVKRCIRSYIDIQKHNNHSFELSDDNILTIIKKIVESYGNLITLSEEEYELLRKDISCEYQVFCIPGQSIVDDYNEEKWYDKIKDGIQPNFWRRYKDYLIDIKHFNPNVISTLGDDTLDNQLMNYLGNPDSNKPYLKRGLIIGDVQSGKTSTYIGLMCKAADAGYKVFILLSGVTEPLRKQTQERVEEGFIGINMSAAEGIRVGVGKDQKPIMASAMTSRKSDFTKDIDKIAVSLNDKNAIVFVIKKNAKVLRKLTDWLVRLNTDPKTQKIDLPMLLIDDEADNASINTSQEKESPTVINKMIRDLANVFTKSNYVGFTATPFANVFIDPETTEKMTNQDLFPEDFIVVLPRPSNYISPVDIFSEKGILYNDKFNELLSKKDFKISKFNNQFYFFIGTKENNLILKCKDVEYKLVERINTINIIQGKNEYFFYFYRKEKSKFDELTKILNIRLYAFNENLKPIIQINIPNFIFDPIHSKVEISKNGKYILLTCDLYLIVIKNEKNHSIINLEKENAIILNLSKDDMENFKNESFKDSKFIEDDKVSSSIGKYNIKWDLKEINKYN